MPILLPSISTTSARQAFDEFLSSQKLRTQLIDDHQTYSALGGSRAPQAFIDELSVKLRHELASIELSRRGSAGDRRKFDDVCARVFFDALRVVTPHEASQPGVWRFMCCVVFPDLVVWRWGRDEELSEDRYLSVTRNTFGRLWKRAYVLEEVDGPKTGLLEALNEDELVQIMERPTIGGNRALAKTLASAFLTIVRGQGREGERLQTAGASREELMRQVTRRIIRAGSLLAVDALSESELAEFVKLELQHSLDAMLLARPLK